MLHMIALSFTLIISTVHGLYGPQPRVKPPSSSRAVSPPKKSAAIVGPAGEKIDYWYEYWYDPRIHNVGNVGLGGRFAALMAPLATALIDRTSYSGLDVRKKIHNNAVWFPPEQSVLDLCCGTGFSTVKGALGVDTSRPFLGMARFRRPDARFAFGNAETYGDDRSYDVVSMMFATHEMPCVGRRRVLRNAMRVAKKSVVVVDIDPDFKETLEAKPMQGASFLSGEPYVLDYLARMDDDIASCVPVRITAPGMSWRVTRTTLVPKHVVVWHLERDYTLGGRNFEYDREWGI